MTYVIPYYRNNIKIQPEKAFSKDPWHPKDYSEYGHKVADKEVQKFKWHRAQRSKPNVVESWALMMFL